MTDAALAPRPKLTTLRKLRIMIRYCRCPGLPEKQHKCGKALGDLSRIEFDHIGARALTGDDSDENFRPLCPECHRYKTTGRRGEKHVTSHGSDIGNIRKADRLAKDTEEFRRRLLAKEPGKPREKSSRWASRKFQSRKTKPARRTSNKSS